MKYNRIKQVTEELIPLEDVINAYSDCAKNKSTSGSCIDYSMGLHERLYDLYRRINTMEYKPGKSTCFIVTRPRKREIFAAPFEDRIVHHLVIGKLIDIFERNFIDDVYNCRKNKGTLYGIKRLQEQIKECSKGYTNDCWILKCDLKGFFMSIERERLWDMLHKFIVDNYDEPDLEAIIYLTREIALNDPTIGCIKRSLATAWDDLPNDKSLFTVENGFGVPIGNLTSQMFANFILCEFDKMMKDKFGYYGRYVDDFYVISNSSRILKHEIKFIKEYLKGTIGVTLHPNKIYLQHYAKGVKFLGAVVKKDRLYVGNGTVSNLYKKIDRFNLLALSDAGFPRKYVNDFVSIMNSYLGYLSNFRSFNIRKKMVDRLDESWINLVHIAGDYSKLTVKDKYNDILINRKKFSNKSKAPKPRYGKRGIGVNHEFIEHFLGHSFEELASIAQAKYGISDDPFDSLMYDWDINYLESKEKEKEHRRKRQPKHAVLI